MGLILVAEEGRWPGNTLVVDAHIDTVHDMLQGRDFLQRSAEGQVDLPRLQAGGVAVQIFALFVEPEYKPDRALHRVLRLWDALDRTIQRSAGAMRLVRNTSDLDAALRQGQLAVIVSVEGGEPVGNDLAYLRVLHALGVRAMGLTWNERNAIADGAGEDPNGGGLTRFGRSVVSEMNRLHMLVDVSHLNERSFWDVLDHCTAPIVASHSNARSVCDHPRNLRDTQIQALAASGGVMGMNFFADFLVSGGEATTDSVLEHIDHIAALVGPEHIGLGSDFDGISRWPRGLEDASCFPHLTEALLRRGYRSEDVCAIMGGNFLRVLRQVWDGADL